MYLVYKWSTSIMELDTQGIKHSSHPHHRCLSCCTRTWRTPCHFFLPKIFAKNYPIRLLPRLNHRLILLPRTPSRRSRSSSLNNEVYCWGCGTTNLIVCRRCEHATIFMYLQQTTQSQNLINFETTYNIQLPLLAKRRAIFAFTTADCDFLTASGKGPASQGVLTSIKHYAQHTFSPLLRCERAQDFNKTLVDLGAM